MLMLQNTADTYVYKKYGLVIPEETVDHVRNTNIITWLQIFQEKLLWKLFIQQKFGKFLKVSENMEVVEFLQSEPFDRKFREEV